MQVSRILYFVYDISFLNLRKVGRLNGGGMLLPYSLARVPGGFGITGLLTGEYVVFGLCFEVCL